MHVWAWFLHHFGIDNTAGPWYGFWSGFGSDLQEFAIFSALIVGLRHKNCRVKGCWRMGHADPDHGHPICHTHQDKLKEVDSVRRNP